ncbi:c2h2 finger domain containing protein [Niveomyces insectorum RCEF 264]|uniref:C2h2 finger domain containing protein n=1 Tax=Niveomyces insectorum RCEF 264 TaxID=1081102 RepID=A0A162JG22_9HYPO|nr:c2h2 finger domain containing protein [Niveomyces insectorum RCEF 264]
MTSIVAPPPSSATRHSGDTKPPRLAVSRTKPAVGMPATRQEPTPPHIKLEEEQERGRPRSRSSREKDSNSNSDGDGDGDANGDNSSNSDGPARKRRRSRKGLDKKFECPHIGCGKSYSRAEHLHRHQLNHTPKQIYVCDYPGCERHFVRLDLCNRHRDRHTAKGSSLNRKDLLPNQASPTQDVRGSFAPPPPPPPPPGSASPESNRPGTGYSKLGSGVPAAGLTYSPKASDGFPYTPMSAPATTVYTNGFSSANGVDYAVHDAAAAAAAAAYSHTPSGRARPQTQPPYSASASSSNQGQPHHQADLASVLSPVSLAQQGFRNPIATSSMTPQYSAASILTGTQSFPPIQLPPSDFTVTPQTATSIPRDTGGADLSGSNNNSNNNNNNNSSSSSNMAAYVPTTPAEYELAQSQSASELIALNQMSMPSTVPMFGIETTLQKSPQVGMPDDFVYYLFNNTPQEGSPMAHSVIYSAYNEFQTPYSMAYQRTNAMPMGYFPAAPQQIMSVTNLFDQSPPESVISEEKSLEIFELIRERFHEHDHTPIERRNELITDGDRTDDTHMLSRKMMQAYIVSYWVHFSDQVPILHKPTFSPDRTPNLLLIAIMTIGAVCLDKMHEQKVVKAGAELSNFLAWHLRWELFMDSNFRPPAKLWVFQTLLLLEVYEKMFSSRELHERAHIHHATTITLMRRGRSLIGKTAAESPPSPRNGSDKDRSSRHSSTSNAAAGAGVANTPDHWWNNWIMNEATRRTAFAAFVIDSIHATMFGHSTVMVAHEMRLALPCDDKLWKATSGVEVGRAEAQLLAEGIRSMSFLEGIKRTLAGSEVKTNAFGRTILMAGLLSISWHMNQRDLQMSSLGGSQALGGRDKWRSTLTRAFDSWKADYDKLLQQQQRQHGGSGSGSGSSIGSGGSGHGFGRGGAGLGGGRGMAVAAPIVVDPYADEADEGDVTVVFESRVVLHHLAHMATHVDVVDLQIYARAKRLLGRAIGAQDLSSAQRRMKDIWAPTAKARDATYYAVQFLCSVLLRNEGNSPLTNSGFGSNNGSGSGSYAHAHAHAQAQAPLAEESTYSARDDFLLNRPWVLYFATLVVWSYGYAVEGPSPGTVLPATRHEQVQQMREYLHGFSSVTTPDDLKAKKGINRNSALLMVLKDTFSHTRWELLHEGATLLGNCIQLNMGHIE